MFCQNCGAKASDESLHCPECGAKIEVPIELGPGVDSAAGYRESATSPSGGTPNSSGDEPRKRKRIHGNCRDSRSACDWFGVRRKCVPG